MSDDHSALFGDGSRYPAHGVPGIRGHIDPALVPYLRAAAEDDGDQAADESHGGPRAADDAKRTEELRDLVENSLLVGPDPDMLADVEHEDDPDYLKREWGEDGADPGVTPAPAGTVKDPAGDAHRRELARAAREADLDHRIDELYRRIVARAPEHKVQPSLERVQRVMHVLGDPQRAFPSIHLTGTNGKTSTARMIDSLLAAYGLKVGRFTSPHLEDVRERISLGGAPIGKEQFLAAWDDVAPYVDMVDRESQSRGGPRLSFFEVFTVMAYAAFADYPVDVGVVEVGMGGRWDATNVIDAPVAVVAPISLDHQQWLGPTIADIAREKAGIIKRGATVVISEQPREALDVLLARAREMDAVPRVEGVDFEVLQRQPGVGGQLITVRTPAGVYEDVFVPLLGEHQAHNAAAALVAVESFLGSGTRLRPKLVEQGMAQATSPGRLEVVHTAPSVVVDAAHNPGGVESLRRGLAEAFGFDHTIGVFSAMRDKDVETMLGEMEPSLDQVVITSMPGERPMSPADLAEVARGVFGEDRVEVVEPVSGAVERAVALAQAEEDAKSTAGVVVFGSIVLAGEARALFGRA